MSSIPTHNSPRRIELSNGGAVLVKRVAKRSTLEKISSRAGLAAGDSASQLRMSNLLLRTGIVGSENLTDPDNGDPVPFTTLRETGIGLIASEAVGDAVPGDDLAEVLAVISGESDEATEGSELSGEQQGN
ncbi:MAG: hypothetical protein AAGI53_01685 [Planctomycetota bacterium]